VPGIILIGEKRRMQKVPEIVLTGGPCSGKTTAETYLSEKLRDKGIRAFLASESATMIITGGVHDIVRLAREDRPKYLHAEKQMVLLHLDLRRRFNQLAKGFPEEKRVVICNRSIMDAAAYMTEEEFKALLEDCGIPLSEARDSFDAIFHLVTAAKGAERFYTKENNPARYESAEEAREADERTLAAWIGHPHLKIIDNSTGFEQKMKRLLSAVCRVLGIPASIEIERKFLLSRPPFIPSIPSKVQKVSIEQVYLISAKNPDESIRIRKRSQGDYSVYYKTRKSDAAGQGIANVRQETESVIKAMDYLHLKTFQDPRIDIIRKNRYCFVYNNQYFELDEFTEPKHLRSLWLLEIELTEENDRLELPPFIQIEREVTNERAYTNYELAKIP